MAIEWRDLLHCAVCLRAFEEPQPGEREREAETGRRLPVSLLCGHTVCRSCLATTTGAGANSHPPRTAPGHQHATLHHSPRGKPVAAALSAHLHAQPEAHSETAADGGSDNKGRAQPRPLDRRHTCPLDHTVHAIPLTDLPVNVALAHLLGLRVPTPLSVPHSVFVSPAAAAQEGDCSHAAGDGQASGEGQPSDSALDASDSEQAPNEMYQTALAALDALALLVSGGTPCIASPAGAPLRVPIYPVVNKALQRKILTLMQCQILLPEGRSKVLRAARSICERIVTELIVMHQNTQQLTSHLWSAVRARGCQFLGPAMQEEVLKLVLLALETGSALSRKVLVMFIVQKLKPQYPQASKTSVGHVVQLLYRASCFKVSKRDGDSSLMELKEEFRNYDALRKEHDAQIIQIAMEAGLRIAPEQWSALLYGDHLHKSHMQSVIDKLQSAQFLASSVQELVIAVQRSGDPHKLGQLRSALDQLASLNMEDGGGNNHGSGGGDKTHGTEGECLELVALTLQNLLQVVSGFLFFMANSLAKRDVIAANRQRPFDGPALNLGALQTGPGKPAFQASHRTLSLSRSLPQSYSQPSFTSINSPSMQQNMFHPMGDGAHSMNMRPLLFYPGPLGTPMVERSGINGVFGGTQLVNGGPVTPGTGSAAYPRRSALAMSLSSSMNMPPALGPNHAPVQEDHVYRPISRQASVPATMRTLDRSPYHVETHGFRSPGSHGGAADYRFFDRGAPGTAGFSVGSDVENGMAGMSLQEELYGAQSPRSLLAQHHGTTEYEAAGMHWASSSPADRLDDEEDALGMHGLQRSDAQEKTTAFGPSLSHSRRMPSSSGNLLDEYARWRDDASTAQGIHRISSLSSEMADAGGSMRGSRSAVFHADYALEGYYYGGSPPFKPFSRLAQSTSTSASSAPGHRQTTAPLEAEREHEEVLSMRLCDEVLPDASSAAGEAELANGRRHNEKWAASCFFSLSDEEHSG